MKIQKIEVKNFRSIESAGVYLFPYMVFVGKNNSGKSNIMKALNSFFEDSIEVEDFRKHEGNIEDEVNVAVVFNDLTPGEQKLYEGELLSAGEENLYVKLRFRATLSTDERIKTRYEIFSKKLNPKDAEVQKKFGWLFDSHYFRSSGRVYESEEIPEEFKELVKNEIENNPDWKDLSKNRYKTLRNVYISRHVDLKEHASISSWEKFKISRKDRRDFLGNYFFIPAVQDIEKETRYMGKGKTNFNNLINYILEQMRDPTKLAKKKEEIRNTLKELFRLHETDSQMHNLRRDLNEILQHFDNSSIHFETKMPRINKMLRDSLKIFIDDGVKTEVNHKGHGLQRFFLVSLFKIWANKLMDKRTSGIETDGECLENIPICSSAYFAIEEPELFLHPQYQRMMRDYLQEIAFSQGNQILLNTHSPNFIEFNNAEEIVKVVKPNSKIGTKIVQPVREEDGVLKYPEFTETWGSEKTRKRFQKINNVNMNHYLNPTRNEMFFADKVVLVEGQTESMMLDAWARYFFPSDIELINKVTYIECIGKFNMHQYIRLLGLFQIPFVILWDSDLKPRISNEREEKVKEDNYHLRNNTRKSKGYYFELEYDFESAFGIKTATYRGDQKVNKPYHAFNQYFDPLTGNPRDKELEKLRQSDLLNEVFEKIYGKSVREED